MIIEGTYRKMHTVDYRLPDGRLGTVAVDDRLCELMGIEPAAYLRLEAEEATKVICAGYD